MISYPPFYFSGKYVASQSDDKSVRIWKTSDWKEETVVTEPFEEVLRRSSIPIFTNQIF